MAMSILCRRNYEDRFNSEEKEKRNGKHFLTCIQVKVDKHNEKATKRIRQIITLICMRTMHNSETAHRLTTRRKQNQYSVCTTRKCDHCDTSSLLSCGRR
mmetsp:Transcript_43399/g.80741  ORF Transcript_43399/g.80741 Transcript_43399/m.80741 type:complete len:100 (-) Transcript_43399:89-388(-)